MQPLILLHYPDTVYDISDVHHRQGKLSGFIHEDAYTLAKKYEGGPLEEGPFAKQIYAWKPKCMLTGLAIGKALGDEEILLRDLFTFKKLFSISDLLITASPVVAEHFIGRVRLIPCPYNLTQKDWVWFGDDDE